MAKALTAAFVKNVRPQDRAKRYHDGAMRTGLLLVVQPTGSRQWIQRIVIHGKRRDIGLGAYPYVTLAEARERAFLNKCEIRRGNDPRRPKLPTFGNLASAYRATKLGDWRANTLKSWDSIMENHVLPELGAVRVDRINGPLLVDLLAPLFAGGKSFAVLARQNVASVMAYAVAMEHIPHNPGGPDLNKALPKLARKVKHHAAVAWADLPAIYSKVGGVLSAPALCLRFITLTAVRSGNEAMGARWEDIDLTERLWSIPADQMKEDKAHRVPLSDEAMAVLEAARKLNPGSALVFPGRKGGKLAPSTVSGVLRKFHATGTLHGMRSSFRDWCAENDINPDVAEAALSHANGDKTQQAYYRTDLLAKRAKLMQAWADYLT